MIFQLAKLGFTIWGIYKGFWVLRKVWNWLALKIENYRAEQNYLNMLAGQIRYNREETGSEFLRSVPR
jgi:hypothetical protein